MLLISDWKKEESYLLSSSVAYRTADGVVLDSLEMNEQLHKKIRLGYSAFMCNFKDLREPSCQLYLFETCSKRFEYFIV